jgi:hypothetical protein
LLETSHEISSTVLDDQLTIIQGSIKDLAPVKETLAPSGTPASIIVSGVGAAPKLSFSLHPIAMDDPHVVEEGITIVLEALRELRREGTISEAQKPLLCTISTTGLSKTRDVPYVYLPLYHLVLAVAHKDKKLAEGLVASATVEVGDDAPLSGFVITRPTLLTSGALRGLDKVRTGWEKHPDALSVVSEEATAPAIGYTISRADIGNWIFQEVIKGDGKWSGKCVSLTY